MLGAQIGMQTALDQIKVSCFNHQQDVFKKYFFLLINIRCVLSSDVGKLI